MNATRIASLGLCLLFPAITQSAGLAYNDNFIVLAPNQTLADQTLSQADRFRQEIAREWLGEEIPQGLGRTVIHVQLSDRDKGLFLPIDGPDRKMHKIWLETTRDRIDTTLRHEIAHLVLSTNFPVRLPAFVDEGIASRYDDLKRKEIRRKITKWHLERGGLPRLNTLFDEQHIATSSQSSYTTAASLTEFLLSRGSKSQLLDFAVAGQNTGWTKALKAHYGIAGVDALQMQWEQWARGQFARASDEIAGSEKRRSPEF